MKHILVTGSISFDVIMDFPSRFQEYLQPDKLHMINVSFVVDQLERQYGGTATNIAYNLGIAGSSGVKLLSSIGKDGRPIIEFLEKHSVDTAAVLFDKSLYTATGHVITDTDNNQIWGFYYGACASAKKLSLPSYVMGEAVAVLSANHPDAFLTFQNQAIGNAIPYLFDPGMTLSWNTPESLREGSIHAKWLVGNDYEISSIYSMTGLTEEQLVKAGVAVITTLGEQGVCYCDATHRYHVPAYKPESVVDPTGAGDAWRAGFLYGIQCGNPVLECLAYGNALASFAIEQYGTVNHKPQRDEIEARMQVIRSKNE